MTEFLSSEATPPGLRRWGRALALMTSVQIAATASILALTALAPEVAASLGIGAHWIGYQISLIYFSGMFASAFAGSVVDALRAERIIVLELGLFAAALLLIATGTAATILVGTLLLGIAYGLNNPASSEILNRDTPRHRHSLVFSFKQSGVPMGAVLANLSLPAMTVALGGDWQLAVLLAALLPLALLVLSAATLRPDGPRKRIEGGAVARMMREQRALYRNPRLRTLALLGGLFSALQLVATAFTVVMLVDLGWSIVAAGSVAAALQCAGAVGRVVWGLVADRIGSFQTLAAIGVLSGLILLSLLFVARYPAPLLVALLVSLGGVVSGWNGVFLAAAARSAPAGKVGANTGALLVYTFIGVIGGPSIFAALYEALGSFGLCFALFSGIGFLGAALSVPQFRSTAQRGR